MTTRDPLERIAAALERLVEIEEAREARNAGRRSRSAPEAPDVPVVDEVTRARARQALDRLQLGKGRGPGGKRKR